MTYKGDSITIDGESEPVVKHYQHNNIQILLRQQVDKHYRRTFDVSHYSKPNNDDVFSGTESNGGLAYMVFSFEHQTEGEQGDFPGQLFPGFKAHQHNIMLFHDRNIYAEWRKGFCKKLICISLDVNFLMKYIPGHDAVFKSFHNSLNNHEPAMLSAAHMPISPAMAVLIDEIITCRHSGYLKRSYQEAKVIELLVLQLEQYQLSVCKRPAEDALGSDIAEKMNRVRDILQTNMDTGFSLRSLAHMVGTNEFSLKKNFKIQFGNTVFGYLLSLKMERSKKMLLNDKIKIAEVAEKLGYSHATHFTSAFKKYFGYLPNKLRLLVLIASGCFEEILCLLEVYGV